MSTLKNNKQNENEIRNYKVYVHINKFNNKKYVGITKQDVKKRWQSGYGYYNKGKTNYFWNAIQKYGWDGFEHIVLENNLTHDEANDRERYYISLYNSNNLDYGYNLTLGGDGFLGQKRSIETREKISKKVKEYFKNNHGYWYGKKIPTESIEKQKDTKRKNPYHHTEEWKINHSLKVKGANNVNSKPVRCINTNRIFANAKEAADYYNTDNSRIHKCCKGIEKSSGKHPNTGEKLFWEYVDKENPRTEIEVIIK